MKSLKIFILLFLFSFSLYAQNNNTPKTANSKPKMEKKYIDLDELRAMKANGASAEEINARYNEMIDAIDHDFHGVPLPKPQDSNLSIGKNTVQPVKEMKPISL